MFSLDSIQSPGTLAFFRNKLGYANVQADIQKDYRSARNFVYTIRNGLVIQLFLDITKSVSIENLQIDLDPTLPLLDRKRVWLNSKARKIVDIFLNIETEADIHWNLQAGFDLFRNFRMSAQARTVERAKALTADFECTECKFQALSIQQMATHYCVCHHKPIPLTGGMRPRTKT